MFSPVTRNIGWKLGFEKPCWAVLYKLIKALGGGPCNPLSQISGPLSKPEGCAFEDHGTSRSFFIC